jgi:hypothetical protein
LLRGEEASGERTRVVSPVKYGLSLNARATVVVFKLIDGSLRALPAAYPGISRKPEGWAEYGPDT